nr:MAG TPA: hypothetical protein [Microviridae sp.]
MRVIGASVVKELYRQGGELQLERHYEFSFSVST